MKNIYLKTVEELENFNRLSFLGKLVDSCMGKKVIFVDFESDFNFRFNTYENMAESVCRQCEQRYIDGILKENGADFVTASDWKRIGRGMRCITSFVRKDEYENMRTKIVERRIYLDAYVPEISALEGFVSKSPLDKENVAYFLLNRQNIYTLVFYKGACLWLSKKPLNFSPDKEIKMNRINLGNILYENDMDLDEFESVIIADEKPENLREDFGFLNYGKFLDSVDSKEIYGEFIKIWDEYYD